MRQHPWSLVCDRFVDRIINDSGYDSDEIVFKLNCDKPIRLYGFVLGFKFTNAKKNRKTVFLAIREDAMAPALEKVYACKYYERENETVIMLENTINKLTFLRFAFTVSLLQVDHKPVVNEEMVVDGNKFKCTGELVTRFFLDNL